MVMNRFSKIQVLFTTLLTVAHATAASSLLSNSTWAKNGFIETKQINPLVISQQVLFQSDDRDVSIYRTPLLTYTPGGHLLLIAEGRQNNSGDATLKYIVARRSKDGGVTWTPEVFLHNDNTTKKEDNLGVVLVDNVKREIYIFFVICARPTPGCGPNATASVMYLKSRDDGLTWGKPFNVTAQAGLKNFSPGPGYGVQKRFAPFKGRLIVCGHGGMLDVNGLFCLLSDDHGATWRWGAEVLPIPAYSNNKKGDFAPDECQPVELPDGSIMINVRNQYHYHCNCRIVMMSYDGMETIDVDSIRLDETLIEPAVCSSILSHRGILFFSNPASETERVNMTVRWSYNNGKSWPGSLPIWHLKSGYSCMTAFPPGMAPHRQKYIYLAFEKGIASSTDTISFVTISLEKAV